MTALLFESFILLLSRADNFGEIVAAGSDCVGGGSCCCGGGGGGVGGGGVEVNAAAANAADAISIRFLPLRVLLFSPD